MSSVATYWIPGSYVTDAIAASIINVQPNATTLWLECASGARCNNVAMTMTVGPWATVSPHCKAPSSGLLDMTQFISVTNWPGTDMTTVTYSLHCGMTSSTVLAQCTYASTVSGIPTSVTLESPHLFVSPQPITITAGLNKLEDTGTLCADSSTMTDYSTVTSIETISGRVTASVTVVQETTVVETLVTSTATGGAAPGIGPAPNFAASGPLGLWVLAAMALGFVLR